MRTWMSARDAWLIALLAITSCAEPTDDPPAMGTPMDIDLLVVTETGSLILAEENPLFVAELDGIVRGLASGDVDSDGRADARRVGSLHAGVVSMEMGVG